MALRKLKPTTPATRYYSISSFEEITKSKPEKSLTAPIKKSGGRNNLVVADIRGNTGLLTLKDSGLMKQRLFQLNMTRIEVQELHSFNILMVRRVILLHQTI
jgi:ribosomal protein L2